MPHVTVKCFPGKSEEQKALLAQKIAESLEAAFGSTDKSISIDIVDVAQAEWTDKVYQPEIAPRLAQLYKKPGYAPS